MVAAIARKFAQYYGWRRKQCDIWMQAIRQRRWEIICIYEKFDRWRLLGSKDEALRSKAPASMEPAVFRLRGDSENESIWEHLEEETREKRAEERG